jgi:hypothetical protein
MLIPSSKVLLFPYNRTLSPVKLAGSVYAMISQSNRLKYAFSLQLAFDPAYGCDVCGFTGCLEGSGGVICVHIGGEDRLLQVLGVGGGED